MDATLALNAAYVMLTAGAFTRNILWLRLLLLAASIGFITFGILENVPSMIAWNIGIGSLHISRIARSVRRARAVELTPDEAAARDRYFPGVGDFDFHVLWSMGEEFIHGPRTLIDAGSVPQTVSLVLEGQVNVVDGRAPVRALGPGSLVGEMSFVSGEAAEVSVIVEHRAILRQWSQRHLATLDEINPPSARAFARLLALDLTTKARVS